MTEKLSDERLTELRQESEQSARNYLTAVARAREAKDAGTAEICDYYRQVHVDLISALDELGEAREELTRLRMATTIVQSSAYTAQQIGGSVQATAEALTWHAAMYSIDRAERAEAKLARIRELLAEYRDDPVAYGQQVARRVLEIMDGDANADDS
jgi:hypothetical protein